MSNQTSEGVAGEYRPRIGPLTVLRIGLGLGYIALGVLGSRDGDHPQRTWFWWGCAAVWLALGLLLRQARTVVDEHGVHVRTVRQWKHVTWDEINFTTSAPSPYFPPADLTLRTVDGREIPTQIPALRWEAVRAYGSSRDTTHDR